MNAFTSISSPADARFRAYSGCAPASDPAGSLDPFAARYGRKLPLALRAEAAGMAWSDFSATYAPQHGPVRLGGWSATALAAGRNCYEATVAVGDTIHTASEIASGPVAGMTAMMHDLGLQLEILSFHRHDLGGTHTTFILCEAGERRAWAMGLGATGTESTLRAMIAGVNRMHSDR
ncbi:2-isopropylmalate synthase [Rhodococcus chondri]|uniref:Alpha-isopropylmalate synthase regulatory domain-containing protein n=1 Tax=Rhodococcus chondri TaxID=3065941 RepID=A0ABU7JV53_9NOCA|nr:2-isopropylmalate synthase [Rhodococcus sp. CC-R104]MEE2033908.1 alpha-isopropylmalate synthase regulatory domain-containing protein [Rhodococcus sp. CC-R104]